MQCGFWTRAVMVACLFVAFQLSSLAVADTQLKSPATFFDHSTYLNLAAQDRKQMAQSNWAAIDPTIRSCFEQIGRAGGPFGFLPPIAELVNQGIGPDYPTVVPIIETCIAARHDWAQIDIDVRNCILLSVTSLEPTLGTITIDDLVGHGIGPDRQDISQFVNPCQEKVSQAKAQAAAAAQAQQDAAREAALRQQQARQEAASKEPAQTQPSVVFQQGQADRQSWEAWFGGLAGDYRAGADYWASHRSLRKPGSCSTSPPSTGADWTAGCIAAQQKIATMDVRRTAEPEYRLGWNSPTPGGSPLAAPFDTATGRPSQNADSVTQVKPQSVQQSTEDQRHQREAAIAAEKDTWKSFLVSNSSFTQYLNGDPHDLIAMLNTNTPRYKTGQIAMTLRGAIDTRLTLQIVVYGRAVALLHDTDGQRIASKMLGVNDIMSQALTFPTTAPYFVADYDLVVITRDTLSDYPLLGDVGARAKLIKLLNSSDLRVVGVALNSDVEKARAERTAAEQQERNKKEQAQLEAQRQEAARLQRSVEIQTAIENGQISDYGLILVGNGTFADACGRSDSDLDAIDAFAGLPDYLKRGTRHVVADNDQAFLSLRRGECDILVGVAADLRQVMAGLHRDSVAFSVFPETVSLADLNAKLPGIRKGREEAAKVQKAADEQAAAAAKARAAEAAAAAASGSGSSGGGGGGNKATSPCKNDWSKCADNNDLVNNYTGWYGIPTDCQIAANKLAKFGTPTWPWFPFGSFQRGTDYVSSGLVVAIEPDAQFQNGFGAMRHSEVICTYDLKAQKVVDISFRER